MIKATLGTKEINIPTKWEDVTLGQLIALNANLKYITTDPVMLLSCLTTPTDQAGNAGNPESTYGMWFRTSVDQINRFILPAISFSAEMLDFTKLPRPAVITIAGKECTVPEDISLASYGQLQLLTAEISKRGSIASSPYAIAYYLQPLASGTEFNHTAALELIPEILALSAAQAFPVADFFLSSWRTLTNNSVADVTKS